MKKIIIVCTLIVLLLPCSLFAQGMKRLKSGYLIAVSEEAFDRCLSMVMNHDDAALGKMVSLGLCAPTKAGVGVYLEDTHLFSGTAEVRPEGSTSNLWVSIEALQ